MKPVATNAANCSHLSLSGVKLAQSMAKNLQHILESRFSIKELYPLQELVISHIMEGNQALVVMPTGSGKSLCFQLPALALDTEGVTLVFSPLIALMEDHVTAYAWWNIAATNGDKDANGNKGLIAEDMTPEQITKAEELTKEMIKKNPKQIKKP